MSGSAFAHPRRQTKGLGWYDEPQSVSMVGERTMHEIGEGVDERGGRLHPERVPTAEWVPEALSNRHSLGEDAEDVEVESEH